MRNRIIALALCAVMLLLGGCASNDAATPAPSVSSNGQENINADNDTSSGMTTESEADDTSDTGLLLLDEKRVTLRDGDTWVYQYQYDEAGNRLEEIKYNPSGEISSRNQREYDSNSNLIKDVTYESNGTIESSHEYVYDAAGNPIEHRFHPADDSGDTLEVWAYDSSGNKIKEECSVDGNFYYRYEWEYDSSGRPIKRTYTSSRGVSIIGYEYNDAGLLIREQIYGADGSRGGWYDYLYNDAGYLLQKIQYDPDGSEVAVLEEYERDGSGNALKEWFRSSMNTLSHWAEYEYDAAGNVVKEWQCRTDRDIYYEYDSYGNKIIETHYKDEEISARFEYEFEYDDGGNILSETVRDASGSEALEIASQTEYIYSRH